MSNTKVKNQLVIIHNDEPRASSWIIKDGFEVEHRALTNLIKKYKTDFEELGIIASRMQQLSNGAGAPVKEFLLNEDQTYFLGTLLPNTKTVRKFKLLLVKKFALARKMLLRIQAQQQNSEWLAQRQAGKITRKAETDAIKDFVEYATNQGSTNANRYYCNISQMENKALFLLEQKFKNLRDILDLNQLATVTTADAIVSKALKEGMTSRLNYKDIYQLAKSRVETLAELRGKTLIPATQQIEYQRRAIAN